MKTNKVVVVIAFLLAAGVGFAQGARGMGGGGISGQPIDGTVIKPRSVQASGTQDQFMCTSTTAVCEVESNISAATMTSTVPAFDIGPTATPGANDRLACFSYGPTGSKTRMMCVDESGDLNATSLRAGVAKYPNQIRLHALTQTTNYAPSIFGGNHAVFGRDEDDGANSGGVWLSYHTTDNEGIVGSLSPGTAWRPLSFAGSTFKFRPTGGNATVTIGNGVTATGAIEGSNYNSTVASGSQAFTCSNTGCRLSLGATGDYLEYNGGLDRFIFQNAGVGTTGGLFTGTGGFNAFNSQPANISGNMADGATAVGVIIRSQNALTTAGSKIASFQYGTNTEMAFVDYLGNYSGNGFVATTASGSALTGGGASGTLLITSNTPDSVTGINGPAAITMQASQALATGDQLFRVLTSTGVQAFAVRTNGSLVAGESTGQGTVNFRQWNSQQNAPTEWINDAALTEKNPVRITHVKDVVADDASLLSIYDNSTTRVMTVSKDGLIRVNASNAAKPTCNADNRGRIFYLDGAASVADTYEVCTKNSADVYGWSNGNTITASATATGNAFVAPTNTYLCLNGSACGTRVFSEDGANVKINANGSTNITAAASETYFVKTTVAQSTLDIAESRLRLRNTAVTIADNGGGTPAASTISMSNTSYKITCNDADGCDVTLGESGALDGQVVTLTNISANTVNFADTAGVSELAGVFAAGQWDTISVRYVDDRWVETSRSNN